MSKKDTEKLSLCEKTNEELATLIQQGEKDLLGRLWEQTERYFLKISWEFYNKFTGLCQASGVERDDVLQICYFVMCDAVEAFDVESGFKFLSFTRYPFINRTRELLNGKRSKDYVCTLNKAARYDEPLDEETGATKFDLVTDKNSSKEFNDIEQTVYDKTVHDLLKHSIAKLKPEQAKTLRLRYWGGYSLEQVGDALNMTPWQARQLESNAIRELRRDKDIQALRDEYICTAAYRATGFDSWKNKQGSIEELIIERLESMRNKTD